MSNAVPLKFKYADPELVSGLFGDALRSSMWINDDKLRDLAVQELVHDISLALFNAGCIVIQLDHPIDS